jgi:fermentation-respiration switch protein FrsA (DUF1100 family)
MYPAVRGKSAVAMLAALTLLLSGAPAAAAVPLGLVLTSVDAALPAQLSLLATAKRITYVTTAADGSRTTATGLVLTPRNGTAHRTVVWGDGPIGLSLFPPPALIAVAALLARGWTVAVPGAPVASSMIDSVRAARHLDDRLSAQYVVDGHAQGGQAALVAAALARAYGDSLELRGVVAIAPMPGEGLPTPAAPILLIQGTADATVPFDVSLVSELDASDQTMLFVPLEGATHESAVTETARLVADWISSRFT